MAVSPRAGIHSAAAAMRVQRNERAHEALFAAVAAGQPPAGALAPGFTVENHATAAADAFYYGERGPRDWLEDLLGVFAPGAVFAVAELLATGEDYVVARFTITGAGARSGYPLRFEWTAVTWFTDARAVRVVGYGSEEQALAAVGLER